MVDEIKVFPKGSFEMRETEKGLELCICPDRFSMFLDRFNLLYVAIEAVLENFYAERTDPKRDMPGEWLIRNLKNALHKQSMEVQVALNPIIDLVQGEPADKTVRP